jgi:hypothetical protein
MNVSPELHPIVQTIGIWAITEYGLERLDGGYPIEAGRLWEADWIEHMAGKRWVFLPEFRMALFEGMRHHAPSKPQGGPQP